MGVVTLIARDILAAQDAGKVRPDSLEMMRMMAMARQATGLSWRRALCRTVLPRPVPRFGIAGPVPERVEPLR